MFKVFCVAHAIRILERENLCGRKKSECAEFLSGEGDVCADVGHMRDVRGRARV